MSHRFDLHVCGTASHTLFGGAVRWITGEPVSHVLLLYRSFDHGGVWWVEESVEGRGSWSQPASRRLPYLRECLACAYRLELQPEQEAAFLAAFGAEVAGLSYDWRINLQLGAVKLGNRLWRRRRWVPRWPDSAGVNCSEAIARAARRCGMHTDPTPTPGEVCAALASWPRAAAVERDQVLAMLSEQAAA